MMIQKNKFKMALKFRYMNGKISKALEGNKIIGSIKEHVLKIMKKFGKGTRPKLICKFLTIINNT